MAKGQIRAQKEKKKPKADKNNKVKQLSAYKQAQLGATSHVVVSPAPKKT